MARSEQIAVWRHFVENSARLQTELDRRLRDGHGMTLSDYQLLLLLHESPSRRLRMHELSSAMVFSASRLTYQVDAMCKRGWLLRETAAEDRRGNYAVLTDDGQAAFLAAAQMHSADVDELFFTAVDDDAWQPLAAAMQRLADHLERLREEP